MPGVYRIGFKGLGFRVLDPLFTLVSCDEHAQPSGVGIHVGCGPLLNIGIVAFYVYSYFITHGAFFWSLDEDSPISAHFVYA